MEDTRDILGELVFDVSYHMNANIFDQMDTLIKVIPDQVLELEIINLKVAEDSYKRKKSEKLMEKMDKDKVALSKEINEVNKILK